MPRFRNSFPISPLRLGQRRLGHVNSVRFVFGPVLRGVTRETHRLLGHLTLVHVPRGLIEVGVGGEGCYH